MNTVSRLLLAASLAAGASAAPAAKTPEKTRIHQELDALGAKIDALAERARRESAGTRAKLDEKVKALRADKSDADRALDKLEAAGASAGEDLRAAFQSAYRKLKNGYRDAVREAPWSKKPRKSPAPKAP